MHVCQIICTIILSDRHNKNTSIFKSQMGKYGNNDIIKAYFMDYSLLTCDLPLSSMENEKLSLVAVARFFKT